MRRSLEPRIRERDTAKPCLSLVTTTQEVVVAIDEAENCDIETKEWVAKCQHELPDTNIIIQSQKVQYGKFVFVFCS